MHFLYIKYMMQISQIEGPRPYDKKQSYTFQTRIKKQNENQF